MKNKIKKFGLRTVSLVFLFLFAVTMSISFSGCDLFKSTKSGTKYTITVVANNSSYGSVSGSGEYSNGEWVTISATPNSGYRFVAWSDGNESRQRDIFVTADRVLVANFEQITNIDSYTITLSSNNIEYGTVQGGGTYNAGQTITITATPNSGYKFVNWNDGNTSASRTITVDSNKTYTANFESTSTGRTYSVVVTSNNTAYGTVTGSGTYNEGQTITITASATSTGKFVNWNDGNTSATRTITVDSNKTYIANFESKYIEITVKNLNSSYAETSTKTYSVVKNSTGKYKLYASDLEFFSYWVEDSYLVPISSLAEKNFSSIYEVSTAKDVVVYCVHSCAGSAAYISTSSDCNNVSFVDNLLNRSSSNNFIAYYYTFDSSKSLLRGSSGDVTDTSKLLLSNYTNHTAYTKMMVFKGCVIEQNLFAGYTYYAVVTVQNQSINDGDSIKLYLPTDPAGTEYVVIE